MIFNIVINYCNEWHKMATHMLLWKPLWFSEESVMCSITSPKRVDSHCPSRFMVRLSWEGPPTSGSQSQPSSLPLMLTFPLFLLPCRFFTLFFFSKWRPTFVGGGRPFYSTAPFLQRSLLFSLLLLMLSFFGVVLPAPPLQCPPTPWILSTPNPRFLSPEVPLYGKSWPPQPTFINFYLRRGSSKKFPLSVATISR